MKLIHSRPSGLAMLLAASTFLVGTIEASAQAAISPAITTPDKVETRIGTLDFKDGMPSKETIAKIYDNLDFTHAFEAFVNTLQGVSIRALHKGFLSVGVKDNEVLVFSELMDAKSLFLTANADTVYSMGMLDLTKGPMVLEVPPKALGAIDDYWFRWVIDIGLPGPDRGEGGKYLILPPGYDGPLPSGFNIARARTNLVIWFARSFLENNDPKPVAEAIRKFTKVYPYEAGGVGTPIADFLSGKAKLGKVTPPPPTVFHEGTGKVMNTIPPNDFSYYEMLNEVVQQEPAGSLDPELMGPIAAIGIIKGKPFAPDARMKKILTEALALANATSRTLFMAPRDPDFVLLPRLGLAEHAVRSRLRVRDADPADYPRRRQALPAHRLSHARRADGLLLRRHRDHARDGHASARHRLDLPVDDGRCKQGALRRRQDLQGDAAEGHPAGELLVVHALRQHDALDARHAAALPARGQPELPVARRRSERRRHDDGLLRPDPAAKASNGATGSRPCPAKVLSRACGSTARLNRSSPRPGGRARSKLVQ